MIYEYGTRSANKLSTCCTPLQLIMVEALKRTPYDITIVHGWRGKQVQDALFDSGASRKKFPHSRHNMSNDHMSVDPFKTSDAIDFAPWVNGTISWNDTHIFACIAGVIISTALDLGYTVRWGGDWDSDGTTSDQTLMDWGHIEIIWT